MEIIRTLNIYAKNNDLQYLLIGGHAVNAYGVSRYTGDIDLLINRDQKKYWLSFMEKINYEEHQNNENFGKFSSSSLDSWPIDLMYVDSSTFTKMYNDSIEYELDNDLVRIVSINHLITLKLHALKKFDIIRFNKDFTDVISLIRKSEIDINSDNFLNLCLKYATQDIYNKIKDSFNE